MKVAELSPTVYAGFDVSRHRGTTIVNTGRPAPLKVQMVLNRHRPALAAAAFEVPTARFLALPGDRENTETPAASHSPIGSNS